MHHEHSGSSTAGVHQCQGPCLSFTFRVRVVHPDDERRDAGSIGDTGAVAEHDDAE